VIITSQRSGSTLLVRSLDSSPSVFCAGELFHHGSNVYHSEFQFACAILGSELIGSLLDQVTIGIRARRHLRHFYSTAGPEASAIGFKLMVSQIRKMPRILRSLMDLADIRIFLYRRDVFDTALSLYRARKSGVFHSDRLRVGSDGPPLEIDDKELRFLMRQCRRDKDSILAMQRSLGGHVLAYEDMIEDWTGVIARIGSELGIVNLRVEMALKKVGVATRRQKFRNEEELRSRMVADDC
jgi:LPS sulfotransferase NodH